MSSQNDVSHPCNILLKQMISKQKKTVLSLPYYIFLIETECIAASAGTIIVARGALSQLPLIETECIAASAGTIIVARGALS